MNAKKNFFVEDCKYTPWFEWSKCDALCGETGNQTRQQTLISDDRSQYNPLCLREKVESKPCTGDPCSCVNGYNCTCDLTLWSLWTGCSRTCGGGERQRTRQYRTDSTDNCTRENLIDTQPCNVDCCPVNGGLTPWSPWSTCSKTCDSGTRERYRMCSNPQPLCNGKPCEGCTVDREQCNVQKCGESSTKQSIDNDERSFSRREMSK